MARLNQVHLIGYLTENPKVTGSSEDDEKVFFKLATLPNISKPYTEVTEEDFEIIPVYTDDQKMVRDAKKLKKYDIVMIKTGNLLIFPSQYLTKCPNCGSHAVAYEPSFTVVYPHHLLKLNGFQSLFEENMEKAIQVFAKQFGKNSNHIIIMGELVKSPMYRNSRTSYILRVDRSYFVKSQYEISADFPHVYSYGRRALKDKDLEKGDIVVIEGYLKSQYVPTKETCICPDPSCKHHTFPFTPDNNPRKLIVVPYDNELDTEEAEPINRTSTIGYVLQKPAVTRNYRGEKRIFLWIRTTHRILPGIRLSNYEDVPVYSDNPEMVASLENLRENDLICLTGKLIFFKNTFISVCPVCQNQNKTLVPGYSCIYPHHIILLNYLGNDDNLYLPHKMLSENYQVVANDIILVGRVGADPIDLENEQIPEIIYPLKIDDSYSVTPVKNPKQDYPYVYSYGSDAEEDMTYLEKDSPVVIRGFLHSLNRFDTSNFVQRLKGTVVCENQNCYHHTLPYTPENSIRKITIVAYDTEYMIDAATKRFEQMLEEDLFKYI